jgi:CRP/FNR family transcriptional regulator, dissimilatory nitrate respiration regulator
VKRICEVVSETRLFKGMDQNLFSEYCGNTSIKVAWKGDIVENEGDECSGLGVLLEGRLALQKYASTGEFATISLLEAGDMYGEDILFGTSNLFPLTIEAITHSKILYIPKNVLIPLMQTQFFLNRNFIEILSDKVCSQNERISLLSQKTLRQKIACYLLELQKKKSQVMKKQHTSSLSQTEYLTVELPGSKEVIAKLLAMPRPSFSRELIHMQKDGFIKVDGRTIRILDLNELETGALEGYSDNY